MEKFLLEKKIEELSEQIKKCDKNLSDVCEGTFIEMSLKEQKRCLKDHIDDLKEILNLLPVYSIDSQRILFNNFLYYIDRMSDYDFNRKSLSENVKNYLELLSKNL